MQERTDQGRLTAGSRTVLVAQDADDQFPDEFKQIHQTLLDLSAGLWSLVHRRFLRRTGDAEAHEEEAEAFAEFVEEGHGSSGYNDNA